MIFLLGIYIYLYFVKIDDTFGIKKINLNLLYLNDIRIGSLLEVHRRSRQLLCCLNGNYSLDRYAVVEVQNFGT